MLSLATGLQNDPDLVFGFAFDLVDDSADFQAIIRVAQLNIDTNPRFAGLWDDDHPGAGQAGIQKEIKNVCLLCEVTGLHLDRELRNFKGQFTTFSGCDGGVSGFKHKELLGRLDS